MWLGKLLQKRNIEKLQGLLILIRGDRMSMFLTDPDCVRQREYANIPAWHDKGYLGKGLSVFCDDVGGSHVAIVADIIQTILPKAAVYTGGIGYTQKSGK